MSTATEIDVKELLAKIDSGRRPTLLDVRNDDEFGNWKIEGRAGFEIIHVPYFDFIEDEQAAIERVPAHEVVVVCAKGGSSEMVADILRGAGIPARNLIGGMIAYGEYLEPLKVPRPRDEEGDFEIWQFNRRGKGCLSYAILSEGDAIVVDPSRAIDVYASFLEQYGVRKVHVLDTHVHADHVSGSRSLAERLGADHTSMKGGESIRVGKILFQAIATPGHTPNSFCFLAAGRYLLSGDTLFTKSVGRPDLGGQVVEWSLDLFDTLKDRLGTLSDSTLVLPAHYSDMTEIDPNGVVAARLGQLRHDLPEFKVHDPNRFSEMMLQAVRTPPPEYARIIDVNLGNSTVDADLMVRLAQTKRSVLCSFLPTETRFRRYQNTSRIRSTIFAVAASKRITLPERTTRRIPTIMGGSCCSNPSGKG